MIRRIPRKLKKKLRKYFVLDDTSHTKPQWQRFLSLYKIYKRVGSSEYSRIVNEVMTNPI